MTDEKSLTVANENLPMRRELNYLQAWDFIERSSQMLGGTRALGVKTPEQAALAMLTGYELGLSFTGALRTLYVTKSGQIVLKPIGALSLMRSSGLLEKFEYEGDATYQTITIKRKGQPERSMTLTIEQAKKAGWKSAAWEATPANMLRWRLIGWLADLEFTDLLLGLPMADDSWLDVEITPEGDVIEIAVEKPQSVEEKTQPDIPDHGIKDLAGLLKIASDKDIKKANGRNALPISKDEINLCVHALVETGVLIVGEDGFVLRPTEIKEDELPY